MNNQYTESDVEGVVEHLEEIAFYLRIDGANRWKVNSYSDAAESLENTPPEILESPQEVDGIGSGIGETIDEFLEDGNSSKLEYLKDEHADLSEIMEVEGVGPKSAKKFYEELDITTLDELENAAENEELQELHRVGRKTEQNILEEIEEVRAGVHERKDWGYVYSYWEGLEARLGVLQDRGIIGRFEPAGSFRRGGDENNTVGDLDVIIESKSGDNISETVFDNIEDWKMTDKVLGRGDTKMSLRLDNLQVDLRLVDSESYGACLLYFTGNVSQNIEMRERAIEYDMKLSEYGLFDKETGERICGETEEDIYETLGYEYLEPSDRSAENLTVISEPKGDDNGN